MAGQLPRAVSGGQVILNKDIGSSLGSYGMVRELVDCTGNAATTKALTKKLPANCRPVASIIRCTTAGTVAGDNLALGIVSGDVDNFFTVAKDSIDDLNDVLVQTVPAAFTISASETSLALGSVTGGSLSGNITAGIWDVTLVFEQYPIPVAV
jgi:hypothetical protein